MNLTRHITPNGPRWACDGQFLFPEMSLSSLLALSRDEMLACLSKIARGEKASSNPLAPLDPQQEVWAAGVTYLRSREARRAESAVASIYDRAYTAPRPELFFKSPGWRVAGSGQPVRVRRDSGWNVPEPELVAVANSRQEIVGYSAGNDVSSRDIEGENPLYLPQAKIFNGSCAVGPGIVLASEAELNTLPIGLEVIRQGALVYQGKTSSARMKRPISELFDYLGRELSFPHGVLLMTGTGIVPPDDFNLAPSDFVRIQIGELTLENMVE
jgi:2-dehydro-3-deoxy-D-arabinonate dehydratase